MYQILKLRFLNLSFFSALYFAVPVVLPAESNQTHGGGYTDLPAAMEKLLIESIDLVHDENYSQALSNFVRMQKELPNHPVGYFFYGASLEWISLDYKNYTFHDPFVANMTKAVELGKAYVNREPKNHWAYFYTGAAYGFMGITMIKYGEWIKAFFDGMSGFKYLTKALEVKPDFYDVYYGVGQFHYWRSKKAKILMLFSTKDEMAQGIEELKIAVAKGKLTVEDTRNSLAGIYTMEGEYDKSIALIQDSLKKHPNYLSSYWSLTHNYIGKKNWLEGLNTLDTVERKLKASPYTGNLAYIEVETLRAICQMGIGDIGKARDCLKKARAVPDAGLKSISRYQELMREVERMERAVKKSGS